MRSAHRQLSSPLSLFQVISCEWCEVWCEQEAGLWHAGSGMGMAGLVGQLCPQIAMMPWDR